MSDFKAKKAPKSIFGLGSAPDPARKDHSIPQTPSWPHPRFGPRNNLPPQICIFKSAYDRVVELDYVSPFLKLPTQPHAAQPIPFFLQRPIEAIVTQPQTNSINMSILLLFQLRILNKVSKLLSMSNHRFCQTVRTHIIFSETKPNQSNLSHVQLCRVGQYAPHTACTPCANL